MKLKSTLILLFSSIFLGFSQQEPSFNKAIGTSCFFAGSSTKVVQQFEQFLQKDNLKSIKKQLFSKEPAKQLVAVVVIEALISVDKTEISEEEKTQIQKIKQSDAEVYICSGCTLMQKVILKDFFIYPTTRTQIQADLWLEKHIKGYKNPTTKFTSEHQ